MAQSIGFVDAYAVDYFPAILGHDMEQVIHHACLGAVLAYFQVKSGIHVHRHRFDLRAALWPQLFKEEPDCSPAAPLSDPQHPTRVRIQYNAGVAMPFEQCELVHDQAPGLGLRQLVQSRLQRPSLQQAHAVPMQPEQLSHVQSRKALASLNDCFGQAARHPGVAIKPADSLHALAASTTANAPELDVKPHRAPENG
ncbi:hypothetical protein D3C85_1060160 [compost metagenome]